MRADGLDSSERLLKDSGTIFYRDPPNCCGRTARIVYILREGSVYTSLQGARL